MAAVVWRCLQGLRRLRLTVGLRRRAVRVAERQQGRLHQLGEEDVLPDQDELGVFLPSLEPVRLDPPVRLLHHTEDGNHQTCGGREGEQQEDSFNAWLLLSLITTQLIPHRQRTCGSYLRQVGPIITSSFLFYTVEYCNTWNPQYAIINQRCTTNDMHS